MKGIGKRLFAGMLVIAMALSLLPQKEAKAVSLAAQIQFSDGTTENYVTMEEAIAAVNATEVTETRKGGKFTAYADIPKDSTKIVLAENTEWTFAFDEYALYSEIHLKPNAKIRVTSGSILETGFVSVYIADENEMDFEDGVSFDEHSVIWISRYLKNNQHCKKTYSAGENRCDGATYEIETLEGDLPYRVGDVYYASPNVALYHMKDGDTLYIEADVEDDLIKDAMDVNTFSIDASGHTFSGVLEAIFNITFVAGTFTGEISGTTQCSSICNDGVRFSERNLWYAKGTLSEEQMLEQDEDEYYVVTSDIPEDKYAFELNGKKYVYFDQVIEKAKTTPGATITALKDCDEELNIPFYSDVKLDFGTHTFSGALWIGGNCEIIGGNFVGEYDEEAEESTAFLASAMSLNPEDCHPVIISGGYFKDFDICICGIETEEDLAALEATPNYYFAKVKGGTFDADYVYPYYIEDMEAENEEDRFSEILLGYKGVYHEDNHTYTVEPIKYNVVFDKNSENVTNEFSKLENCDYDKEYTIPSAKEIRPGYDLEWNTQADGSGEKYNPGDSIKNLTAKNGETVTFYAIWKCIDYTISYHLNDGTPEKENPTTYTVDTDDIELKNPTRSGYIFDGWYSDSQFKNKVTKIVKGSTGNRELYAKWTLIQCKPEDKTEKYTIAYQLNGGKNSINNPTTYLSNSGKIALSNPTKKGYTFKGWYSDSKLKNKVTEIALGSKGNKTFYAKWAVKKYKISYQLKGGKNNKKNPKKYTVESKKIKLAKPKKKGYTFKGWYRDKKYKKKVTKIAKGSTGNIKLYAKWKKK